MSESCLRHYELQSIIGEGSFGTVYAAEHRKLHHRVAVKILHQARPDRRRRLLRDDARAIRLMRHPHIAQIIEAGRLPKGQPYLMTELVAGETLGDRLRRLKCLPLVDALDFAIQAAGALGAAHERGIVHRGLTREDLFLLPDLRMRRGERVKVGDFAAARLRGSGATGAIAGELPGSAIYLAPEQLLPRRKVDHRADIYALGGIVYHALCGAPPFVAGTRSELVAMHLHENAGSPRRLNPEIPARLDRVILRALAKRPDERFDSMESFVAALRSTIVQAAQRASHVPAASTSVGVAMAICAVLALSTGSPLGAARSAPVEAGSRAAAPRGPTIVPLPADASRTRVVKPAAKGAGRRADSRVGRYQTALVDQAALDRDDPWGHRF